MQAGFEVQPHSLISSHAGLPKRILHLSLLVGRDGHDYLLGPEAIFPVFDFFLLIRMDYLCRPRVLQ